MSANYKKDTIGYHYEMAKVVLGKDSKAVKWLEEKAAESPNGMNEGVMLPESQVLLILGKLHFEGKTKSAE